MTVLERHSCSFACSCDSCLVVRAVGRSCAGKPPYVSALSEFCAGFLPAGFRQIYGPVLESFRLQPAHVVFEWWKVRLRRWAIWYGCGVGVDIGAGAGAVLVLSRISRGRGTSTALAAASCV